MRACVCLFVCGFFLFFFFFLLFKNKNVFVCYHAELFFIVVFNKPSKVICVYYVGRVLP